MTGTVRLTRSGLITSRIGFGTSRLHYMSARERQAILNAAADAGILHFDTAPAYGDTLAEAEIGRVLGQRRQKLIIVSKYGIAPSSLIAAAPALATPVRAVRAVARHAGLVVGQTRAPMTASGLRASVEQSLRRLKTSWLDALLLHEPSPAVIEDAECLYAELLRLRERGLVRHFGLAGAWEGIAALRNDTSRFGEIIQTAESEWPQQSVPDLTYGALSQGPQSCASPQLQPGLAVERLQRALARRPSGTVLISTRSPQRLLELVRASEQAAV